MTSKQDTRLLTEISTAIDSLKNIGIERMEVSEIADLSEMLAQYAMIEGAHDAFTHVTEQYSEFGPASLPSFDIGVWKLAGTHFLVKSSDVSVSHSDLKGKYNMREQWENQISRVSFSKIFSLPLAIKSSSDLLAELGSNWVKFAENARFLTRVNKTELADSVQGRPDPDMKLSELMDEISSACEGQDSAIPNSRINWGYDDTENK